MTSRKHLEIVRITWTRKLICLSIILIMTYIIFCTRDKPINALSLTTDVEGCGCWSYPSHTDWLPKLMLNIAIYVWHLVVKCTSIIWFSYFIIKIAWNMFTIVLRLVMQFLMTERTNAEIHQLLYVCREHTVARLSVFEWCKRYRKDCEWIPSSACR